MPNNEIGTEEAVADLLGWTDVEFIGNDQVKGRDPADGQVKTLPAWAYDVNAVSRLEEDIENRGLGAQYIAILRAVVLQEGRGDRPEWQIVLKMIHASASQRASAVLKTLQGVCQSRR